MPVLLACSWSDNSGRASLSGRVAYLGGATAHQYDRFVPRLLQYAQHQFAPENPHVGFGGAVKADVGRHDAGRGQFVQRVNIGGLMDITSP